MASYVTKEYALRHGKPYPPDFLNRIKRRDLRLLGIAVGAVLGVAFQTMVALGVLSHVCVAGILAHGWRGKGAVSGSLEASLSSTSVRRSSTCP